MRNLLILMCLFIFSLGCGSDDENMEGGIINSFEINGESSITNKGFIADARLSGQFSPFAFIIALTSDGIGYNEITEDLNGEGDIILLGLSTPDSTGLPENLYVYQESGDDPFTIDGESIVALNFNTQDESGDVFRIVAGSLQLNRQNQNYLLDYTFTLSSGEIIEGSYNGALRVVPEL